LNERGLKPLFVFTPTVVLEEFRAETGVSHVPDICFGQQELLSRIPDLKALSTPFSNEVEFLISVEWFVPKDVFGPLLLLAFISSVMIFGLVGLVYIASAPKKLFREAVNDYCPIILLNCLLKVFKKNIVNSLQNGFIQDCATQSVQFYQKAYYTRLPWLGLPILSINAMLLHFYQKA
jgi:hypothetical protein